LGLAVVWAVTNIEKAMPISKFIIL